MKDSACNLTIDEAVQVLYVSVYESNTDTITTVPILTLHGNLCSIGC